MSATFGYIEFSDGGDACEKNNNHGNKNYKTYLLKDCPVVPPPPKPDPTAPKTSPPIDPEDYQGVRTLVLYTAV